MKTIRCFMALAAFALLVPISAYADSGLSQEKRNEINRKNAPSRITTTIDPEQQKKMAEDAGKEACLATSNSIGGVALNVTKDQMDRMFACCQKVGDERTLCLQAIRQEVQEQHQAAPKKEKKKPQKRVLTEAEREAERLRKQCESEGGDRATCSNPDSARFFVNQKLCQQFGGGDKCETPDGARQFVLDYRSKKRGEAAAQKLGLAPAPAPEAPPPGMPPETGYGYGTPATPVTPAPAAPAAPFSSDRTVSSMFLIGAEFLGYANGPYGPNLVLRLNLTDYLDIGVRGGYAYTLNSRMNDRNMKALNAGSVGADALVQYPFLGRYAIGAGPIWNMVVQLGATRPIIVQTLGGQARISVNPLFGRRGLGYVSVFLGGSLFTPPDAVMPKGVSGGAAVGAAF